MKNKKMVAVMAVLLFACGLSAGAFHSNSKSTGENKICTMNYRYVYGGAEVFEPITFEYAVRSIDETGCPSYDPTSIIDDITKDKAGYHYYVVPDNRDLTSYTAWYYEIWYADEDNPNSHVSHDTYATTQDKSGRITAITNTSDENIRHLFLHLLQYLIRCLR